MSANTLSFFKWIPGQVVNLPSDTIFVFGSNRLGVHGSGSARSAIDHYGAIMGIGEGIQHQSYGLPTCSVPGVGLTLDEIRGHVENFKQFVQGNKRLKFYVTAVGCGYAGYTDADIAPMFKGVERCIFPVEWKPYL